MSGRNPQNAQAVLATQPGDDLGVNAPYVPCKANRDPRLLVRVYCDTGGRTLISASVRAGTGAGSHLTRTTGADTGMADFSYVAPGNYAVTVERIEAPQDQDYFVPANATVNVALAAGDKRTVDIIVERKNVVTPKVEAEYLAVLLDRGLSAHQAVSDLKRYVADATYVELSIGETNEAYRHQAGARLSVAPANVECYLDERCRVTDQLDANGDITDAQLRRKQKVWLRGTAVGKFTATLTLNDAADARIRNEAPAELEMGVVELIMKLHKPDATSIRALTVNPDVEPIKTYHDQLSNLDLPDPVEMTDQEKVQPGRILHVQKKGHFSRAKLELERYTSDHWPQGCDDYEIVLGTDYAAPALAFYDKEWDGSSTNLIKIKVKDLKAKNHKYWLEGKATTPVNADVRFELRLDRAEGGLAKMMKCNADWARFKVVQIAEVKVDYAAPVNSAAAWNDAEGRFYINLQADPAGRRLSIGATLSTKVANVEIHFMLVPDKNNGKKGNWGVDLPGSWVWRDVPAALKHKDKAARTDLLHLSANTDANGYAKVELELSRFGGDRFTPAAYLAVDPHLAKYVRGQSKLEKKKPVMMAKHLTVWRKFWYQVTKPDGLNEPVPSLMTGAYKKVFAEVVLDDTVTFTSATAPPQTFYPESMFKVKSESTDAVANIGDQNKNTIAALYVPKPDQPVKRHLMVCVYQCDTDGVLQATSDPIDDAAAAGNWVDIDISPTRYVLLPALQGGSFIQSLTWHRQSAPGNTTPIDPGNARVPVPRKSRGHIQVQVPAIAPAPTAADPVFISATCYVAKGFLGESFNVRHTLAVYDEKDKKDFQDTITHEFGHSFNQTPRPGAQPGAPSIPDHPTQADRGQGNHCQVNKGVTFGGETKYTCVLYDSGPMKWGLHRYCKTCHPYLLVENFNQP